MSDELSSLRAAIQALSRRHGSLGVVGRNKLKLLASNLKTYERINDGVLEERDARVLNLLRELLIADIRDIEAELKNADTA